MCVVWDDSKFCGVFLVSVLFDYKPAGVKEARERV